MEWFALIIPILISIILFVFFKKEVVWWEMLLPIVVTIIFILIFKVSAKELAITDTEYRGAIVQKAEYYEYWSTWVTQTCSRQVYDGEDCTTDANGRQTCVSRYHTEYYDCSYCDEHSPDWSVTDNLGRTYSITQEKYQSLIKQWSATPNFIDLQRAIYRNGSCGIDGNKYEIYWNQKPETSEATVEEYSYTNKVQASHSSFKLPIVKKEEAKKLQLYFYPKIYGYKQQVILGLDSLDYSFEYKNKVEVLYQYLNGLKGPQNKVKVFVCLFYNKPLSTAFSQEAFWDGGNQNEVVICIGLDKATKTIEWVKPFSWTDDKRILIDLREDIAETKIFDPMKIYPIINDDIKNNSVYKNFKKDFAYLSIELTTNQLVWIYCITALMCIGVGIWSVLNPFNNDNNYY